MKKLFLIVLLIIVVGGGGGYLYFNNWYNSGLEKKVSDSSEAVSFTVEPGESSDSIAAKLEEAGLIDSELLFKLYLRRSGRGSEIQAGDFLISRNRNIPEIVDALSNAVKLDVARATIVEGYKLNQISSVLEQAFTGKEGAVFTSAEFNQIAKSPDSYNFNSEVQAFLDQYKPAGKSLEGFLYPDTYEFDNTATTKSVIEDLIEQFIDKTDSLTKGDDFYEKLVLASIIERESLTDEERDEISSVFNNRLDIGMALQSDATVNYATGKSDPRPTYEDLKIDSPYNTYKYAGLPPTPICSPRLESIEAAINPADTDYYYFIHEQDGSGQVHFAETESEHNANISKYLD